MASRWMQGMKARERSFRKRLGNASMTDVERRFQRRKVKLNREGVIIGVESIEDHLERMVKEAKSERENPKSVIRVIARLAAIESIHEIPLNYDEYRIIRNKLIRDDKIVHNMLGDERVRRGEYQLAPNITVADLEVSILRYRRLTNRKESWLKEQEDKKVHREIKTKTQSQEEREKRRQKAQAKRLASQGFRTFTFKPE